MKTTSPHSFQRTATGNPPPATGATHANIRREVDADDICHLVFDRPGASANLFDRETLLEFERHVTWLRVTHGLRGVILRSAKPSIFIAGADLKTLSKTSTLEIEEILELGQRVFTDFESLPLPKVAAIHGACLGGGYELALCCDWRLASDHPATKVGLPETQLGLLPAWGGSTRLPRLVGVQKALAHILKGPQLPARAAKKAGLVDEVVTMACVTERAKRLLREFGRQPFEARRPTRAGEMVAAPLAGYFAKRRLQHDTRDNYPALEKARQIIVRSPWRSLEASLAAEREAFTHLVHYAATRNLIRLFFQRERAKKATPAAVTGEGVKKIDRVGVIGAGVMGSGIAWWLAAHGRHVDLIDVNDAALARAAGRMSDFAAEAIRRGRMTPTETQLAHDRLTISRGDHGLDGLDLVIEAALEDPVVKRQLFSDLVPKLRPDTLLATNTSALPVASLSADKRLVGLHFFNPVAAMPLVEIVQPDRADDATVAAAVRFVQDIGKVPLVVKDRPGFLINRILVPYLMEAARMAHEGMSGRVIDDAMRDFGMPMGPLRLLDEIGLDVALHVAETMAHAVPDRMRVPEFLREWVEAGRLGRKTGQGFYRYAKGRETAPDGADDDLDEVAERLSLLMTNEAARCLDEGVATTAEDIDLGMVLGTGFAPFRGGPLRHAEEMGLPLVVGRLHHWQALHGPLYAPAPALVELAASGRSFFPQD